MGVFLLIFIISCKKGENDPSFSLKSRKARLAGHWALVKGKAALTLREKNSIYNANYQLEGTSATITETYDGGVPTIYIGTYVLSLDFSKNGDFTFSETLGSKTIRAKGTWDFTSGIGETKKKEEIVLNINSISSSSTGSHLFNKFRTEFKYMIRGLGDKELEIFSSTTLYENSNGERDTYSTEYKLKKG